MIQFVDRYHVRRIAPGSDQWRAWLEAARPEWSAALAAHDLLITQSELDELVHAPGFDHDAPPLSWDLVPDSGDDDDE